MKCRHERDERLAIETLEARRLLAATVTATQGEDGVIVVTGTRRADDIAVVEHFPGLNVYDVIANGTHVGQFGGTGIRIVGRGGNDRISVAGGIVVPATLLGEAGADTLLGGGGADVLDGGAGGDALLGGGGGADALSGRLGNDALDGGDADDTFEGGAGRDVLFGGAGADVLLGEAGADTLNGGEGDDAVDGGGGRDVLTGGPGADHFASTDRLAEVTDTGPEER